MKDKSVLLLTSETKAKQTLADDRYINPDDFCAVLSGRTAVRDRDIHLTKCIDCFWAISAHYVAPLLCLCAKCGISCAVMYWIDETALTFPLFHKSESLFSSAGLLKFAWSEDRLELSGI